ncbi:hypothetical protein LIER_08920 [Lithospermum erythrorhizon]|uniref:Gag-Pol polyprotein n=1 Tax=Lithospermum erythrorhizon TaxID=34254 RepID=A0AAV3PGM9_LITER
MSIWKTEQEFSPKVTTDGHHSCAGADAHGLNGSHPGVGSKVETCEEDVEVSTHATKNSPDSTSRITTDEPDTNSSCNDIRSIQPASRIQKNNPVDNIIGQLDHGITTRRKEPTDNMKMVGLIGESYFISKFELKNVNEALKDEHWISAMQEELLKFQRNDVWELVPKPKEHVMI